MLQICYDMCMKFDYVLADPTGNITVLVKTPYTDDTRSDIIRESFEKEPACEQVGFIVPVSDRIIRLEMMGYEFCGHATLSAAAWHALMHGLKIGQETVVSVDSSGVTDLLDAIVRRIPDRSGMPSFEGTVKMPVPEVSSFRGYPLVQFSGISHLIVPAGDISSEEAEQMIKRYTNELAVPALGMMLCSEFNELVSGDPSSESVSIRPLVYVPGSDTLIWEHGCATGSTAVGCYRSQTSAAGSHTVIKQPGGIIHVDVTDGQPYLTATVTLLSV